MLITYIVLFYKHTLCVKNNVVAFENKTEKVFSLIGCVINDKLTIQQQLPNNYGFQFYR